MRSGALIAAAVLIPLLLFLSFDAAFRAREERRTTEAVALAKAESLVDKTDAVLFESIASLGALATIQALPRGDIANAYLRAQQIAALNRDWVTIKLTDVRTGTELFDLRRPLGAGLLARSPPRAVTRTGIGGIERDGNGCPCVAIRTRASGPEGDYLLTAYLRTEPFERLLPPRREYEVSALVTPDARFVARSLGQAERVGQPASQYVHRAATGGPSRGIYQGRTLEGFENYSAFSRSKRTGWSAHVALGRNFIDSPSRRFFGSISLAALLSLLLATILVLFAMRQLAQSRRALERGQQAQKMEALGQLTGGIAHDFNNLLTPIVGALDFLTKKPDLDARARRLAEGALASAKRAGKLTSQLLAFSRRQKLAIEPVDVRDLFDDIRPLLDQSVGSVHRVTYDLDPEATCVRTDLNQLELAVLNLVINARDASPEGGAIRVETKLERDGDPPIVAIRVIDDGEGMEPDVKRRATEPFFTTKTQGRGSGLGLAQVFGLMEQSKGVVDIDSAPGAGTTVTLRLPLCQDPAVARMGPPSLTPSSGTPLRLLIVDDDAAARATIVRAFDGAAHSVDSVGDPRLALTAIEQCDYDLAIVDFAMPEMDGATLIARARAIKPELKFLLITGYADSEAIARQSPDTELVRKPFDDDTLRAKVDELTTA